MTPPGVRDRYLLAFLNGLIYTENCYSCPYARQERPGDLTLGDAWGSLLPPEQVKKGISLVLCQTEKGKELLDGAALHLEETDRERAMENNHQLRHPSEKPQGWEEFFDYMARGNAFEKLVARQVPKQCRRQDIKAVLSRMGLYRPK